MYKPLHSGSVIENCTSMFARLYWQLSIYGYRVLIFYLIGFQFLHSWITYIKHALFFSGLNLGWDAWYKSMSLLPITHLSWNWFQAVLSPYPRVKYGPSMWPNPLPSQFPATSIISSPKNFKMNIVQYKTRSSVSVHSTSLLHSTLLEQTSPHIPYILVSLKF